MSFFTDQGCILVIAKTYTISVILIFCLFVTISRYLKKKIPHHVALGELLILFNSLFNTDILDLNIPYNIKMLWILNGDWHFYIHKNWNFSMNNLIFDVEYPTLIHQVNKFVKELSLMKLYHLKKQRCAKASCLLISVSETSTFLGLIFKCVDLI